MQALRRSAQTVVGFLEQAVAAEVFDVTAQAYNVGHRAGVAELGALDDDGRRLVDDVTPNAQAVDRLAEQTVDRVTDTHRAILRAVVDKVPRDRRPRRRYAVPRYWQPPASHTGRDAAVCRSGHYVVRRQVGPSVETLHTRRWPYVPQWAAQRQKATCGRRKAPGDLVTASNAPRECPLCRPWEGKVLTISGPDGAHAVEVEHAIEDGRTVRVNVAGSLDAARRAGLQHPNCRHSVSAYTPGITRTDNATSDPAGDEAGQRQRAIERNIRNTRTGPPPLSTPSRSAPRTPRSASGRAPCAST